MIVRDERAVGAVPGAVADPHGSFVKLPRVVECPAAVTDPLDLDGRDSCREPEDGTV